MSLRQPKRHEKHLQGPQHAVHKDLELIDARHQNCCARIAARESVRSGRKQIPEGSRGPIIGNSSRRLTYWKELYRSKKENVSDKNVSGSRVVIPFGRTFMMRRFLRLAAVALLTARTSAHGELYSDIRSVEDLLSRLNLSPVLHASGFTVLHGFHVGDTTADATQSAQLVCDVSRADFGPKLHSTASASYGYLVDNSWSVLPSHHFLSNHHSDDRDLPGNQC
jgi:hypothetical protein